MSEKINIAPSSPYEYEVINETTRGVIKGAGRDPKHGNELYRMEYVSKPVEDVEKDLINDTDRLIGALDGSIDEGDCFLYGERRTQGPVDGAIYLDKSARPVRALVSELWRDMSSEQKPQASFLNIDKENWLYAMGYSREDFRGRYINPSELNLDKMDSDFLLNQVARIRSLYLDDEHMAQAEDLITSVEAGTRKTDELIALWDMPTVMDGKHVAIVDEVKSSKATLTIADMLLQRALPDTDFEPVFFSTPSTYIYDFYDQGQDEMYKKITDTEKPIWYDASRSDGRGGIEDVDTEWSGESPNRQQRLGKYVLSTPFMAMNGRHDTRGSQLRRDMKHLAERFRDGKIRDYIPQTDRDDYISRVEQYYNMPFQTWLAQRRAGVSMTRSDDAR